MEIRSYDEVFKHFKQYNYDALYQRIGLKRERADWLFHIIHNDFNEKNLAQKFGIDEHMALQFLEVAGDHLRELLFELEEEK